MTGPILYLEPVGGIAGDMFLAAALDLGVALPELEQGLSGLGPLGFHLKPSRSERHHITGTHLDVLLDDSHGPHDQVAHFHRGFAEIRDLIRGAASMSATAKGRAEAVFWALAQAEAKIHGVPPEEVHFHEVGAVDSIVDICGAAVVLDLLGDPEVFCAPPPLGSGTIKAAHGTIPVPAPAALELLRDVPVRFEGVGELTTPTGAALVKVLTQVKPPPPMTPSKIGYGVGTKDFPDRANVLRATLGQRTQTPSAVHVIEANLDDFSPQLLGALVERLLAAGALDAYVLPATMKKGRPGHLLGAIVRQEQLESIQRLILTESSSLGVRHHPVERTELDRRHQEVSTVYGRVRIKLGVLEGRVLNAHPEFEDCRALAETKGVPLKDVVAAAITAWGNRLETKE